MKPYAQGRTVGLFAIGNRKLGNRTVIFNMSSSTNCPSRKLNLCPYTKICYAQKAERLYPACLPYRERQHSYWREKNWNEIFSDMAKVVDGRGIKYFRYNEAGDFEDQHDIEKLNQLSIALMQSFNIITYGYTQRRDLNFKGVHFLAKGSNWNGPNGKTVIVNKGETIPKGFKSCTAKGCGTSCVECMLPKGNIAFHKH